MTIVNLSAFVTNDYLKTEPFLISTYHTLKQHKTKPNDLFYNIQVLYIIANTLFRNKKFKESLLYLNEMHQLMLVKKHKYYNSFKLKHKLLHALIDNYSNNQDKAIHDLELVSNLKHTDIESILDINLSLSVFYIQKNDFKKASSLFKKFYHTDKWYTEKAGIEWVIKKNLIEIILHIELGNIDIVESRILSFKRQYFKYLKQINEQRTINYFGFVEHYYKYPESVTSI
jgi:tetratricopeptide (TPR) repeat protein